MTGPAAAQVGICGIQLVDAQDRVARTCARFPTPGDFVVRSFGLDRLAPRLFRGYVMNEWPHDADRRVDHVIGAFYLVRRELFETLHGFDERFFVYLEDLDFSLRASRIGWRCHFLAGARAFHRGGGTSEAVKARRLCYSLRSRLAYASKHFGPLAASAVWLAAMLVEPWTRLALALLRVSPAQALETLKAYRMLLAGEGAAARSSG
jgi:GT2 family glycosyltransferase